MSTPTEFRVFGLRFSHDEEARTHPSLTGKLYTYSERVRLPGDEEFPIQLTSVVRWGGEVTIPLVPQTWDAVNRLGTNMAANTPMLRHRLDTDRATGAVEIYEVERNHTKSLNPPTVTITFVGVGAVPWEAFDTTNKEFGHA